MKILVNPFDLIGRGGSDMAAGVLFLVVYSVLVLLVLLSARRILGFAARERRKVIGRVVRKYSLPEHREWQGKAYVKIPEKQMLEIDVADQHLHYGPVQWKYDRVKEGDAIDVLIQTDRLDQEVRICDVGPF
jgi:DNA helicase TIP49 (TBP-interacting protein)